MPLRFRNTTTATDAPVSAWGFEELLAAVDRGSLPDWQRIVSAVRADPRGELVETLREVFEAAEDSGVVTALRRSVELAQADADAADRRAVARRMTELVAASGLDQAAFARRIGTSRTRLNTYLNGRTTPSAAVLLRAERLTRSIRGELPAGGGRTQLPPV